MKRMMWILMATFIVAALPLSAAEMMNSVGESVVKDLQQKGEKGFLCLMDIKTGQKIFCRSYGGMPQTIPPFSMAKPLIVNSAMKAGVIQESSVIDCGNKSVLILDGAKVHDVREYGKLSVAEILKTQSNIGVFLIADLCRKNKVAGYEMPDTELVKYTLGHKPVFWDDLLKEWQTMLVEKQKTVSLLSKSCQAGCGVAVSATCLHNKTYYPCCIGYFPTENPRYILLVVVSAKQNQPYYGKQVALPVWKKAAAALMNCQE